MRILLIAFLFPVSICSAQYKMLTSGFTPTNNKWITNVPLKTDDCTVYAVRIDPLSDSVSYKTVFLHYFKGTPEDFEFWAAKYKLSDINCKCKYVEVRIKDEGVYKDMTFAEFKKLIWPSTEVK